MSECEHAGRLTAYYDGELDAAARAAMELHLAQCPACAAELARLRRLSAAISGMVRPAMPPRALRHLHKRIDLLPALGVRRLAAELTAVAAAILLACCLWLWRSSSSPEFVGPLPVWEASALQRSGERLPSSSEEEYAAWMVQDLSRENGHDQR